MWRTPFFTLAILLALPAPQIFAAQNEPAPQQIETPPVQIEPPGESASTPDKPEADEPEAKPATDEHDDAKDEKDDDDREDQDDEHSLDPNHSPAPEPDPELTPDHKDDQDALDLELTSAASTRGEGALDLRVHATRGALSAALGMGDGGGAQSSQRQWVRAQLGVEVGVSLSAAGLWEPVQAGATQAQLQLSTAGESERSSWEIALLGQDSQLSAAAAGITSHAPIRGPAMELSGISLALEGAHLLDESLGLRATAHAGAGLYSLTVPKSAAVPWAVLTPWDRLGERGLLWPARADGALGISLEGSAGTASVSLGAGLPAQAGSLEGETTCSLEHALGRATFSLELTAAHLWPADLWQGAMTFGVRWRFASG